MLPALARLPLCLLELILEWDVKNSGLEVLGNFACTCSSFAGMGAEDYWTHMYRKATGSMQNPNRASRSAQKPRIAFFRAVRLSLQRAEQPIHAARLLIHKKDAPIEVLSKCLSDGPGRGRGGNNKGSRGMETSCSHRSTWLHNIKDRHLQPIIGELMLYAAYLHRWNSVKCIITQIGVDKNYRGQAYGETVLILASWSGNNKMVEWLLDDGNGATQGGVSCLVEAEGRLQQTSFCGGSGPYSALVWAQRKAALSPPNSGFHKCAGLLESHSGRY